MNHTEQVILLQSLDNWDLSAMYLNTQNELERRGLT